MAKDRHLGENVKTSLSQSERATSPSPPFGFRSGSKNLPSEPALFKLMHYPQLRAAGAHSPLGALLRPQRANDAVERGARFVGGSSRGAVDRQKTRGAPPYFSA